MKSFIYITTVRLNSVEGIPKKILAEASALNKILGHGWLISKTKDGYEILDLNSGEKWYEKALFDGVNKTIMANKIDAIYVRHTIPSFSIFRILRKCNKSQIRIYYELPTYPYFGEQLKVSRNKLRTCLRLAYEGVFWPLIYFMIDSLVTIRSNTRARVFKKMRCITNGVETETIALRSDIQNNPKDTISCVAVGTIYPYHGYDRILKGLKQVNEKVFDYNIEVHFIGESDTLRRLQKMADDLNLKKVVFHGKKSNDQLNEMYDDFDIGLGCLALHRRNANIDTTLKIIEYYCRGVTVVTSGISPLDSIDKGYTIHIVDSDDPIDIKNMISEFLIIKDKQKEIAEISRKQFSWYNIMKRLTTETGFICEKDN